MLYYKCLLDAVWLLLSHLFLMVPLVGHHGISLSYSLALWTHIAVSELTLFGICINWRVQRVGIQRLGSSTGTKKGYD